MAKVSSVTYSKESRNETVQQLPIHSHILSGIYSKVDVTNNFVAKGAVFYEYRH